MVTRKVRTDEGRNDDNNEHDADDRTDDLLEDSEATDEEGQVGPRKPAVISPTMLNEKGKVPAHFRSFAHPMWRIKSVICFWSTLWGLECTMIMSIAHCFAVSWIGEDYLPNVGISIADTNTTENDTEVVVQLETALGKSSLTEKAWSKFPPVFSSCVDVFSKYWCYVVLINKASDYSKAGFCGGIKFIGLPPRLGKGVAGFHPFGLSLGFWAFVFAWLSSCIKCFLKLTAFLGITHFNPDYVIGWVVFSSIVKLTGGIFAWIYVAV